MAGIQHLGEDTSSTVVKIAADTTLYAQWTPNTVYDLTQAVETASCHSKCTHLVKAGGSVFTKLASFAGWNTEPDGNGTHYEDEEVVINYLRTMAMRLLYAQWSINSYTVTFNSVDGTSVEAITAMTQKLTNPQTRQNTAMTSPDG